MDNFKRIFNKTAKREKAHATIKGQITIERSSPSCTASGIAKATAKQYNQAMLTSIGGSHSSSTRQPLFEAATSASSYVTRPLSGQTWPKVNRDGGEENQGTHCWGPKQHDRWSFEDTSHAADHYWAQVERARDLDSFKKIRPSHSQYGADESKWSIQSQSSQSRAEDSESTNSSKVSWADDNFEFRDYVASIESEDVGIDEDYAKMSVESLVIGPLGLSEAFAQGYIKLLDVHPQSLPEAEEEMKALTQEEEEGGQPAESQRQHISSGINMTATSQILTSKQAKNTVVGSQNAPYQSCTSHCLPQSAGLPGRGLTTPVPLAQGNVVAPKNRAHPTPLTAQYVKQAEPQVEKDSMITTISGDDPKDILLPGNNILQRVVAKAHKRKPTHLVRAIDVTGTASLVHYIPRRIMTDSIKFTPAPQTREIARFHQDVTEIPWPRRAVPKDFLMFMQKSASKEGATRDSVLTTWSDVYPRGVMHRTTPAIAVQGKLREDEWRYEDENIGDGREPSDTSSEEHCEQETGRYQHKVLQWQQEYTQAPEQARVQIESMRARSEGKVRIRRENDRIIEKKEALKRDKEAAEYSRLLEN